MYNNPSFQKSIFESDKKKILFCTYQTPITYIKPFNAFYKIFREMYSYLYLFYEEKMNLRNLMNQQNNQNNTHSNNSSFVYKKAKKFSDEIINIILDEECFYLIKYLELILKQDLLKLFEKKFKSNNINNNVNNNNNLNINLNENRNYDFTLEDQRENTFTLNKSN